METQKATAELKSNIQVLTDKKVKREEDLLRIVENIKQLKQALKVANNDVYMLHGAISAYEGAVKVMEDNNVPTKEVVPDGAA